MHQEMHLQLTGWPKFHLIEPQTVDAQITLIIFCELSHHTLALIFCSLVDSFSPDEKIIPKNSIENSVFEDHAPCQVKNYRRLTKSVRWNDKLKIMHWALVIDVNFKGTSKSSLAGKNFHVPLHVTSITHNKLIAHVLLDKTRKKHQCCSRILTIKSKMWIFSVFVFFSCYTE